MLTKIALISLFVGLSTIGWSQDAKLDIARINEAYQKHHTVLLEQVINYYPNYESTVSLQTEKAIIKKKGNALYTSIYNTEKIATHKYEVEVDHELKVIRIYKSKEGGESELLHLNFNDLLAASEDIEPLVLEDEDRSGYRFRFKESQFTAVDIIFDNKEYTLSKMVLFYRIPMQHEPGQANELPRVEISYTGHRFDKTFKDEIFSEKMFVHKSSNGFSLNDKYKNYGLVDYTNTGS